MRDIQSINIEPVKKALVAAGFSEDEVKSQEQGIRDAFRYEMGATDNTMMNLARIFGVESLRVSFPAACGVRYVYERIYTQEP